MRTIKYLVVHCTATPQTTNVESIQRHWRERLGWKASGYHKIVKANGEVITLATDEQVCNGVAGFNSVSLHVSYIGGIDSRGNPLDNRTQGQKDAISQVLHAWRAKYPDAKIQGHRDFLKRGVNWKECPSFNAKAEYSHI
jgi:N-acetylmuramoyl-L-alanine amidase